MLQAASRTGLSSGIRLRGDFMTRFLTVFLALLITVPAVGAWSWPWESKSRAPCVSPAQIKMADRTFHIPRPWKLAVNYVRPGNLKDLCHAPLTVTKWGAFVPVSLVVQGTEDFAKQNGYPVQPSIPIRVSEERSANFKSLYEDVKTYMRAQKIKVTDLPVENGFRVRKRKDWPRLRNFDHHILMPQNWDLSRSNIYIASDVNLLSPKGEPAIFVCRPFPIDDKTFEECRLSIWDGTIDFTARRIDTRRTPKDKFKELYAGFLKLRQALLSNTAVTTFEKPQEAQHQEK